MNFPEPSKLLEHIDYNDGFIVGRMGSEELTELRAIIRDHYLMRILNCYPTQSHHFYKEMMSNYHLLSEQVEHQELWPKRARTLAPHAVERVKRMPFFKGLTDSLNIQRITGEDGCGWEEIYWRIVRPGSADIGSFHADKWFWDLGHTENITGFRRLKIWIAIDVVPSLSGLRVLPRSQLKSDWRYHGEIDHTGKKKPKFDEDIDSLDILNVNTEPGDFIVFHDELIHCGMPNMSNQTRVSLEATLLIPAK